MTWVGLTALLALVVAGVAVGGEGDNRSTKAVAATFSAEFGDHAVRTCTGADGRYRRTSGDWEGKAESADAGLAGDLEIHGTAFVHVPSGNGTFEGRVRIGGENGLKGSLVGVIKGDKIEGMLTGHAGLKELRLIANVSATFSGGDLSDGKIGGGGGANTAVLAKGDCAKKPDARKDGEKKEGERKEAEKKDGEKKGERAVHEEKGELVALSATSLTVKAEGHEPLTCTIGEHVAADVAALGLAVGARVHVICVNEGTGFFLMKVRKA